MVGAMENEIKTQYLVSKVNGKLLALNFYCGQKKALSRFNRFQNYWLLYDEKTYFFKIWPFFEKIKIKKAYNFEDVMEFLGKK